jgi:2-polyprenyl-6-methoxyphenol hydroxylase-like FAD-dependent oxidoreductase
VIGRLRTLPSEFSNPVPSNPVPTILDTLGLDSAVHVAQIEEVIVERWSSGPMLLVGDAAHATAPDITEGAAMGLEDSLVPADCLASGSNLEQAPAVFRARRRPRTQWVLAQTHRRDRTRNLPPALRNLVLRRWGHHIFQTSYRPLRELP